MELKRYGVTFHRLTSDKIELVRNWRNDPKISKHMFFKEYITPEMQLKWFNSINNDLNYYFIIEYNNEEIGLINIKNIDKEKKCGETGLFIYDDKYLGTDVSFRASFLFSCFVYEELKLDYTYIHVRMDNKRAIRYNIKLGARIEISEDGKTVLGIFTRESFFKTRDKIDRLLSLSS